MSDYVQKILQFDAIAEAERKTGKSYKDDEGTALLGMLLALHNNIRKEDVLKEIGDTYYGITFDETVSLHEDLGFEIVHRRTFTGRIPGETSAPEERYFLLWHPDGILACVESYDGGRVVNTAKIYYNVEFRPDADYWQYVSSGGLHGPSYARGKRIWCGAHDTREGLRHKIDRLRSIGTFRQQWVERPFMWLLTYQDAKQTDIGYRAINEKIIAELPEHARTAITPKETV